MKFTSNLASDGTATVTNLPDPTSAQQAATKAYVDSAIEGLAWKDSCRVATQSNINLSSPGATIDGITMVNGDRVLVQAQTLTQNQGIYVWNGSSSAMSRSADANTAAELEQAVTTVEEGTSAGVSYRQTAVNFTLGTDPVLWSIFGSSVASASEGTSGIAALATQSETNTGTNDTKIVTPLKLNTWSGRPLRYSVSFGDGSATQYDITHNLGTKDVHVSVRQNSDDAFILCDVTALSTTVVRLNFAALVASNALRVTVLA